MIRSLFLAFLTAVGVSLFAADAQAARRVGLLQSRAQLNRSEARLNNAAAQQLRLQSRQFRQPPVIVPVRSFRGSAKFRTVRDPRTGRLIQVRVR